MSDHAALSVLDGLVAQVAAIEGRLADLAKGMDVTLTNQPTNSIRWTSSANRWEKWNGSAWAALTASYAIDISGNAATASTVSWAGVSGRPTTVAGYGITDAITTGNIGSQSVSYASSAGVVAWSGVSGKPTTLSGYGITDGVKSDVATTWTAKQTFSTTQKIQQTLNKVTIGTGLSSTQDFDWLSQAELYFSSTVGANWTLNVRGNSTTTLNASMAVGESTKIKLVVIIGATPWYCTGFTIDGVSVTPRWKNGSAPSAGITNCINVYTYEIIKTGSAAYIVLASLDSVDNKNSSRPLLARASGVADAQKTITANVVTKIKWNSVDFDTDPNRVAGTYSGLIGVSGGGSDAPNGNIYLRRTGYYRIKAQAYYQPPQSGGEVSGYITIVHAGTSGTGTEVIAVHNDEIPQGEHPALSVDRIVKNDTANTYYYINTYYFPTNPPNPATLDLQTDGMYCWIEVEYLGEL